MYQYSCSLKFHVWGFQEQLFRFTYLLHERVKNDWFCAFLTFYTYFFSLCFAFERLHLFSLRYVKDAISCFLVTHRIWLHPGTGMTALFQISLTCSMEVMKEWGRGKKKDGLVRCQVFLDAALRPLPGQDHQEAGAGRGQEQEQRGATEQNEKSPWNPDRSSEESAPGGAREMWRDSASDLWEGRGPALAAWRGWRGTM